MQASTLVSLRAHAVLIALCVAASDAAWLLVCGCSGHVHALQSLAVRMATLASAAGIAIFVRRIAKRAFHRTHAPIGACDWLAQLHLELCPAESRRDGENRCKRAASSGRSPRGRA
ncbi:hypothetical protein [Caballeronia sp. Lep1P3]|uniref:hypothetical protein n=1 Tax=Caballeronia sp. Lep1P3 TaxID=2878150 RepID=UPI001FD59D78|nr:hypothetical protein [Caballeronia sp. Lep1P3]